MSSTYTSTPANVTPSAAVDVTIAADGDAVTAAARNVAIQELTDYTGLLMGKGTVETTPQFPTLTAPSGATAFRLRDSITTLGGANIRTYSYGGNDTLVITYNAEWYDSGGGTMKWRRDIAGDSTMWFHGLGIVGYYHASGSASPWVTASWSAATISLAPVQGTIAAAGDISTTAGDITATAGNLIATGDPASDEARLKGKQIVTTSAAKPTIAAGAAATGTGGAGTATVTNGSTDAAGDVDVTTGAGAGADAAGNGVMATVTLDKSYPVAPRVVLTAYNNNAAAITVHATFTAANVFTISTTSAPLTNSASFKWSYVIVGTAT